MMMSANVVRGAALRASRVGLRSMGAMAVPAAGAGRSDSGRGSSGYSRMVSAAAGLALGTAALYSTSGTQLMAHAEGKEGDDSDGKDPFEGTKLFPQPACIDKGMLKVSDVHTISYEVYGNPKGKPVLFVHGGPGGGTDPSMARYFDPKAYKVILVDQRGCGNSTPFADLTDNTTWDLVRDFEKVRKKLKVDKWQVFGGSWGSTLALAYAVTHPERTTEIVLRGIFLLSKQELDWFYEGVGTKYIYPEEWEAYEAAIPEAERGDGFINAYYKRLMGHMGEDAKYEAAKAWSIYEGSVSKLRQPPKAYLANKYGTGHFPLAFARIENHYFVNKGFFKRDNWLLEDAQMDKIKDIPTVMVHGRYDALCPAGTAWALHKKLPKSELFYTITGHSGFETDIIEKLVYATEKYKSRK